MEIHKGIYEKFFTVRHSEGKSLTCISKLNTDFDGDKQKKQNESI
jgi:hypothetical protein